VPRDLPFWNDSLLLNLVRRLLYQDCEQDGMGIDVLKALVGCSAIESPGIDGTNQISNSRIRA
jgi:hypothetical protein